MHVSKQDKVKIDAGFTASILLIGKNKKVIFTLIFLFLILINYLVSDKISAGFGLDGFKKSFTTMNNLSVVSALVIAPLLEESIFRYFLTRNNSYKFFIYLIFSIIIILFINIWIGVTLLFSFSILTFIHFNSLKKESKFRFLFFILFSAITFSIIHIPVINADTIWINILIVVISLFPIGLFFSIVRSDLGFKFAIFAHIAYNLLTLILNEIIYQI